MDILNVGVILAAGHGERSGFEQPKQMMKLAGRPLVEHTLRVFQDSPDIHEILVVTNAQCLSRIEDMVAGQRLSKVKGVLKGGKARHESSLSAIAAYSDRTHDRRVRLIFHDAVRPLVDARIIRDVVKALDHYNAVDVVVPTTDTIVSADPMTNTIESIPDRSRLRNGQTPQGFALETIREAYERARHDPYFRTTDDCGVVLKYLPDEKVYLVEGAHNNMKLTYAEDLHVLDKLLQLRSRKTLAQADTKLLAELKHKVVMVVGGTSGIGEEMARLAQAYQAKVVVVSRRNGVNVGEMASLRQAMATAAAEHGRIDFIVNCAAILSKQPLLNMAYDEVLEAIQVNYVGAVNVAIAGFEHLRKTRGQLLNFTSSSYTYGRAHYSLYSSSKAAVVNLTQALAEEWHPEGVRVNCINPERTNTPMRRKAFGIEPPQTLLDARAVAIQSLLVLLSPSTGQVFDVRLDGQSVPAAETAGSGMAYA
ncbi:bifunctional cytidylyltransferase/SDR family oxidoreductase [Aquabacterium sp.]|uniref:bifunctional cytidylyltransferase/SDR family oxidoreductase n=1 Tax=Aquabacterium sp. TaxID=1872578 RepID=UPI0025C0833B|nr:bifunctional cytidylyltransferase/SDR family oxidoreductase [Aquabacterium sp.]